VTAWYSSIILFRFPTSMLFGEQSWNKSPIGLTTDEFSSELRHRSFHRPNPAYSFKQHSGGNLYEWRDFFYHKTFNRHPFGRELEIDWIMRWYVADFWTGTTVTVYWAERIQMVFLSFSSQRINTDRFGAWWSCADGTYHYHYSTIRVGEWWYIPLTQFQIFLRNTHIFKND
jgi:hypothetical protein